VIHHEARHPTPASISLRSRFADPPPPGEGETSRPPDARHRPCCLRRGGAVASFSVLSRAWGLPHSRHAQKRARGTPDARCARSLVCEMSLTHELVTTKAPAHPAFRTRWFFRLASCSPRRRLIRFVRHRRD
jgi:hypothetical protein